MLLLWLMMKGSAPASSSAMTHSCTPHLRSHEQPHGHMGTWAHGHWQQPLEVEDAQYEICSYLAVDYAAIRMCACMVSEFV